MTNAIEFGPGYIDVDEWRDDPVRHRYVHGGFAGTDTRFSFYFPPPELYGGRFLSMLEGGVGGSETMLAGPIVVGAGIEFAFSCGAYAVESNQGHIGADVSNDPAVMTYGASAQSARFAREVAKQMYGDLPHHGYLHGVSGGGNRALQCVEHVSDVWDGALAFVHGLFSAQFRVGCSAVANAQRLLTQRDLHRIVDAVEPGGSGDPFAGLSTSKREALAAMYAAGWPRGAERSILWTPVAIIGWAFEAQTLRNFDPTYVQDFWNTPGYRGADGALADSVVEAKATVGRVVRANEIDLSDDPIGPLAIRLMLAKATPDSDLPVGILVSDIDVDAAIGATIKIVSGAAAGRELICIGGTKGVLCSAALSGPIFDDVEPGDEVSISNREFLAFCDYHRHQLHLDGADRFKLDGVPVYPQRALMPLTLTNYAMRAPEYTGAFTGKLITINNTCDELSWPEAAVAYYQLARRHFGDEVDQRFRLWWSDHASHVPPMLALPGPAPVTDTRLVDYQGAAQQAVRDLIDWVERDVEPPASAVFDYDASRCLRLAATADDRRGIQPVVRASANGGERAEVSVGSPVELACEAEVPPRAGTIVAAEWDFDGLGTWEYHHDVGGAAEVLQFSVQHVFDMPGTYFPAVRITSEREGRVDAKYCRVSNLARVRVVVA